MNKKLAITMGDPAGIGPEIAIKALKGSSLPKNCDVFIIGDALVLSETAKRLNIFTNIMVINSPDEFIPGQINVLNLNTITPKDFELGENSKKCGESSYKYIIESIKLALEKSIDGVITNPINKASLKLAGINYPGHTEIFADKTNTKNFSMMFKLDNVCVVHVTTHCSLLNAIKQISKENVYRNIELLNKTLLSLGVINPRIAVSGLNPHAGEGGLFGTEEHDFILPAVNKARKNGILASDPLPPDTVFMRAFNNEFDGIVSMLHDHGFVALKSKDFERGVNITVGLPIIRTSVGHGTAFDIAGKGVASETSLLSAIEAAYNLASNK